MILHHWQRNIRMNTFSDETCFSKTVLIYLYSFQMVHQSTFSSEYLFFVRLFHLSTSPLFNFNLWTSSSLLINLIMTYQLDFPFFWALNLVIELESYNNFHLFCEFLAFSCRFLDAVNSGEFWYTWWKTSVIFIA